MTSRTISGTYPALVSLAPGGDDPVTIAGGAWLQAGLYGPGPGARSVTNFGIVQGTTAIALAAGSTLVNNARVQATTLGVSIYGAGLGVITNTGTILATDSTGTGIALRSGGSVANQSGSTIDGGLYAVESSNAATLTNQGVIGGNAEIGVGFSRGAVTNAIGATIEGSRSGIRLFGGGSVENAGTISGAFDAVHFYAGSAGRLTVDPGAVFIGLADGGNTIGSTVASMLELAGGGTGTLDGLGSRFIDFTQVTIDAGANWTLTTDALGAGYTITDSGTLTNTGSLGSPLTLTGGAVLTNSATGTIAGSLAGVDLSGGYITNQAGGVITGGGYGVVIGGSRGTLDNSGTILATQTDGSGVDVTSTGLVINRSGGTISGGRYGVRFASPVAGTLVNAGSIGGSVFSVQFQQNAGSRLVVDPGAVFSATVSGGAGTIEVASGLTLAGLGSAFADFSHLAVDGGGGVELTDSILLTDAVNDGSIDIAGGYGLGVTDFLDGTGTVTIEANGELSVVGTAAASGTVRFAGPTGLLQIGNAGAFAASIAGFLPGDTIDLYAMKYATGASATITSGVLTVSSGGIVETFNVGGLADTTEFSTTLDPMGFGTQLGVLCFCAGTQIATPTGEVPVERLRVGDLVRTRMGAVRPVVWIGTGRVLATRGRRSAATPVVVKKSALADNVPYQDLRVTKGHAFLLDGVLIPVEFLVNHRSILWDDRAQDVALYHVELAAHDVLLANGAPAESYRDDGNRWLFQNANSGWAQPPKPPCAPVLTGGPVVDAVWRRLLERAGPRPGVPLTEDPDLHLLADGVRVDGERQHMTALAFRLPHRPAELRIVSRTGQPAELGHRRDPRPLGVALRKIVLRQGGRFRDIAAADARLARGFHSFEPAAGLRWTDGDAVLPADLLDGFERTPDVLLHLAGTTRYPLLREAPERYGCLPS